MKYFKQLPLFLFGAYVIYALGFSFISSGLFDPVSIQQIQFKSADSLALGRDKSDMLGDSVEFIGKVVASPRVSPSNGDNRTLLRGQNSYTCYIQDSTGGIFGGIVVRQGTRGPNTLIDVIDTGQTIRVRGVVQEFPESGYSNSLTQVALDTAPGYIIEPIGTRTKRPAPIQVNITDFANGDFPNGGTINYVGGEKYEGMYVELRNVTVAGGVGNRQPWSVIDGNGNKLYFRDFSNFFTTDLNAPPLDTSYRHPSIGTHVNYIRGVIIAANNEGAFGNQLPYAIVPIYPNDLSIGNAPPVLSSPLRNPGVPTPADSVQVTVSVTDPALSLSPIITEVRVFWKHNDGAYSSKVMPNVAGNLYSAKMPPSSLGTLVEYFIRAEDNQGGIRTLPSDTSRSTLFYIVRTSDSMSVQDVQYCPNNGGRSAYEGYDVRGVEGIITADTSDIPGISYSGNGGNQTAPRRVMIQNGTGPWSGLWISGPATDMLQKGQRVRVSGTVQEEFSVTRIAVPSVSNIVILSAGNTQPPPEILTTAILANNKLDGDTTIEKWESVFVRFNTPVSISCINAGTGIACTTSEPLQDTAFRRNFGEILVKDFTGIDSRIELQDGNSSYTNNWDGNGNAPGMILLTKNDSITFVQGILYFSFSNYKLTPRKNDDFGTVIPVGIYNNQEIVGNYSLSQNYPNPFNPVTIINFNLPVNAKVNLKIYDILGREITKLVSQDLTSGNYSMQFDGSKVASGVYFYSLHAEGTDGSKFLSTKRMVLVK